MKRDYFLTFLLCGGLLLSMLTGCKSSKKVGTVESASVKAHNEFFQSVEDQSFQFRTLTARLNVDLDIPGKQMSSRVDMKMVKDSAFQLSVQPFLGIEIFRIELSRDTIKVVDRMNKRYMIENYSNLQGQTPIEFNFYNLQALFTNHLFIPGEQGVSRKHYNRFKLNQEGPVAEIKTKDAMGLFYTFKADGEEKLLSTYVADPSDRYALQWLYEDFRLVDRQPFPMLMDVQVLKNGNPEGGVKIHYSRIQLDEPLKLDFSVPSKYKRMRYVWIVLLALSLSTVVYGQKSAAVRQLEQQRKEALADIEETNKLLQETAQTAKTSLNRLNLLSKQILSRKKVISLLNQELDEIEKDILNIQGQLRTLKRELGDKQTNYGKSMRGLYKRHSSQDQLLFILSAESFAQSMRRMRYLREYADWQKRQANDIVEKQAEISRKQAEMEKTRAEKRALLGTRQEESKKLESEEASQKEEVQLLNKRQKDLKADLQKKRRQAEALNRQIEKQIAEEIARAEAEAKAARERAERERRAREQAAAKGKPVPESKKEPIREERVADTKGGYAMTKAEKQLSDNFANNRGRLPYPVAGRHTIVATFGEQQHQELKYVRTSNSGIDIQTSPGADARAVFNGEVTRVFVVPGYNNSVIVRHGNYLTVYSNLSQVYVKAGDRVSTRQAIGRIYSDPEDGNSTILHFQLWKEKTKLNPQPWLE